MDTTARLARSHQCLRFFVIVSMAAIIASLVASAPAASASASGKCIEIKEDYDLRSAARDSNVFIIVHEPDSKEARDNICNKLEATPARRLTDAVDVGKGGIFAYLEVKDPNGEGEGGNRNFAKNSLGVKQFPSFMFVSKGMDGKSKYSNHITHYKGSDSLDLSDVEKFIESKVGFRVGNDVYNIIFFDSIASRFMSYGEATGLDRFKQRFLSILVRFSTLFSFKEPFTSIGKLYNRAFAMSFEHGMDYCEKQLEKLENKLGMNKEKMSQDKIHEFQQKIAILRSFAEPKELTSEDDKQIFIHAALHVGLLLATLLLFIIPAEDSGSKGEEEVIVEAKVVDGEDEPKEKAK